MARANTKTKLSLDRWAELMSLNPLHWNQVRLETPNPICSDIYFQFNWQTADHVSREQVAQAIAQAETDIEQWLGYSLAPEWQYDEWRPTHRPNNTEFVNLNGGDARGYRQTVKTDHGYFITGGVEAKSLIEANAAIVYSDTDLDGYFETATVTVATTVTDKNEIGIFYPSKDADDAWEIQIPEVTISGGNATIVFRREQAVIPELLLALDIEGKEAIGTDNADFLTEVDVYRRYNDPQTQVTFLWEPLAGGNCSCGGSGCAACAYGTQNGCLTVRGDPRQSIIGYWPATWNADTGDFDRAAWAVHRLPDIVRLYYYAGWRDKSSRYTNRLASEWERTIAYMAAARLERPPCDCSADTWRYWREDFNLMKGNTDGDALYQPLTSRGKFPNPLDNPFGSRRGELAAWNKVSTLGLIIGSAVAL